MQSWTHRRVHATNYYYLFIFKITDYSYTDKEMKHREFRKLAWACTARKGGAGIQTQAWNQAVALSSAPLPLPSPFLLPWLESDSLDRAWPVLLLIYSRKKVQLPGPKHLEIALLGA